MNELNPVNQPTTYQNYKNQLSKVFQPVIEGINQTFTVENGAKAAQFYTKGLVESHLPGIMLNTAIYALGTAILGSGPGALAFPLALAAAPWIIEPVVPIVSETAGNFANWTINKTAEIGKQIFGKEEVKNNGDEITNRIDGSEEQQEDANEVSEKSIVENEKSYGEKLGATVGPMIYNIMLRTLFGPIGTYTIAPLTIGYLKPLFEKGGEELVKKGSDQLAKKIFD